jgi:hypothetical protein
MTRSRSTLAIARASASKETLHWQVKVSCYPILNVQNGSLKNCQKIISLKIVNLVTWDHKIMRESDSERCCLQTFTHSCLPVSQVLGQYGWFLDNNQITCNHSDCLLSAKWEPCTFQILLSSRFSVWAWVCLTLSRNLASFLVGSRLPWSLPPVYFSITIGLHVIILIKKFFSFQLEAFSSFIDGKFRLSALSQMKTLYLPNTLVFQVLCLSLSSANLHLCQVLNAHAPTVYFSDYMWSS